MISVAIDTSAKTASIAIFKDSILISEYFLNAGFTHTQTLMSMLDSIFKISNINVKEVAEYIVVSGPGSFTGLRIGMATVKGLAALMDIPCKSVSTIESLAYNLINLDGIICPVMDARCNQVYTAIFECKNKEVIRLEDDCVKPIEEVIEKLSEYKRDVMLLGDGAYLFKNYKLKNVKIITGNLIYQRASSSYYAAQKYNYLSHYDLVPTYLRLPQAQRQLIKNR